MYSSDGLVVVVGGLFGDGDQGSRMGYSNTLDQRYNGSSISSSTGIPCGHTGVYLAPNPKKVRPRAPKPPDRTVFFGTVKTGNPPDGCGTACLFYSISFHFIPFYAVKLARSLTHSLTHSLAHLREPTKREWSDSDLHLLLIVREETRRDET